jgi:hypothetical protein
MINVVGPEKAAEDLRDALRRAEQDTAGSVIAAS